MSKRRGSSYRSGRVEHWRKIKNPSAPAVKREAEEDWGNKRWSHGLLVADSGAPSCSYCFLSSSRSFLIDEVSTPQAIHVTGSYVSPLLIRSLAKCP